MQQDFFSHRFHCRDHSPKVYRSKDGREQYPEELYAYMEKCYRKQGGDSKTIMALLSSLSQWPSSSEIASDDQLGCENPIKVTGPELPCNFNVRGMEGVQELAKGKLTLCASSHHR